MTYDFGENLKNLRTQKGFTQEELAEFWDVSKQSISRWENNVTYPDITFLPTIASFYDVTVDSLLGADLEKVNSELSEYYNKRQEAHCNGYVEEAFNLSQKIYAKFPNNKTVMHTVVMDSYLMGEKADENKDYYYEISISVAQRLIKLTDDIEMECSSLSYIARSYKGLNNKEKAEMWLKKLPSFWDCIEYVSTDFFEGDDRIDNVHNSFHTMIKWFYINIISYMKSEKFDNKERLKILNKVVEFINLMFENEDFGFYNRCLSDTYIDMAEYEEDPNAKIEYLKKAYNYAVKFDELNELTHTSILFKNNKISSLEFTKTTPLSQRETFIERIKSDQFLSLVGLPEFENLITKAK